MASGQSLDGSGCGLALGSRHYSPYSESRLEGAVAFLPSGAKLLCLSDPGSRNSVMTPRRRVGFVHHNLMVHRGGGDFVCAWALQALQDDYDVTLLTWGRP